MSRVLIAANAPMTVSQVALYQGADREKILIDGAKKEGAFTLLWLPFLVPQYGQGVREKISIHQMTEYRTDGRTLIKRAIEENKAGQYIADVIATTGEQMDMMKREGIFLEHWTTDARAYPDDVKKKARTVSTTSDITRPMPAWVSTHLRSRRPRRRKRWRFA